MAVEYPIKADYVADWGVLHAMREIIANALDAETQLGARKEIIYLAEKRTVRVINYGVTLEREALLLGGTSKDDQRLIGQYGEGLKLALLVFARLNIKVRVRNGRHESWTPAIKPSKQWGAEVLTLDIRSASRQLELFEVEVQGIEPEVWAQVEQLFLFMKPATSIDTPYGQVLTDATHAGKIYVKGVFVTQAQNYDHGYNFFNLDIGRDRQIPNSWDMQYEIQRMHRSLLDSDGSHIIKIYEMLEADRPEAAAFRHFDDDVVTSHLAERFQTLYGDKAIPCAASSETIELEHLGVKGVAIGSRILATKLQSKLGSPDKVRSTRKSDAVKTWSMSELEPTEQELFEIALTLIERTEKVVSPRSRASVVDFNSEEIHGTHQGRDVRIARKILNDFGKTVFTLAHEFAHDAGPDGSYDHISAIHGIAEAVMNLLYKEKQPWRVDMNS